MIGANGIAVLAAAPERVRSRDTLFIYRPDSDFYYLTGFPEPEAVAVLVPGRPQGEFLMFCRERNPERELWDGPGPARGRGRDLRRGRRVPDRRPRRHPARAARAQRPRLLLDRQARVRPEAARVHPDAECEAPEQPRAERARRARSPAARDAALQEPRRSEHDAPLREDRGRGARARDASDAARDDRVRARGRVPARVPSPRRRLLIPADRRGRRERCVLHYRANDAELRDGDLVLIDAGCELEMYASDVTRHVSRSTACSASRSASSTTSCSPRIAQRRRPRRSATTGTIRTTRPSARSRAASRTSACFRGRVQHLHQDAGVSPVLHAPHRPLARPRRA